MSPYTNLFTDVNCYLASLTYSIVDFFRWLTQSDSLPQPGYYYKTARVVNLTELKRTVAQSFLVQ